MESLGEKLRAAREEKGINFDQVSRETNIASRYLEALETENFSGFPGEPYILGFLRNYGEYLGLDVQELLSLYRALKIQEQPIPVDQLLRSPPQYPRIIAGIVIALVILAAAGGGFYFLRRLPAAGPETAAVRQPAEYVMNADSLERRLYRGDSVLIPLGPDQYKIELANLGEAVTIATPSGSLVLDLGQEVTVNLDGNGTTELRITAADFVKNDSNTGVLLRFELYAAPPVTAEIPERTAALPAASTVIFTSPQAYPFTLQAAFQGYCMFRWEILFERDRPGRSEQYFQRSDELNIQAQNGIRVWASNAQTAKFQVIGGGRTVPVELGGAGEVVVADIRWVRDDDNRYRLILARLEQ
ncbi:MAG: helix-turn-helix domain-containing protein [Treponema sp.]|nr:helix-turn-helix domain-containing protein [Treponema sp.]